MTKAATKCLFTKINLREKLKTLLFEKLNLRENQSNQVYKVFHIFDDFFIYMKERFRALFTLKV